MEEWTAEDFTSKRKEFVSKLKEWDKLYNLHQKSVNPDTQLIIDINMKPLNALMKSNKDYYLASKMLEAEKRRGEIPVEERIAREFRIEPLEREFVKDYSEICRVLSTVPGKIKGDAKVDEANPNPERYLLTAPYDIQQMLDTLQEPNWENI